MTQIRYRTIGIVASNSSWWTNDEWNVGWRTAAGRKNQHGQWIGRGGIVRWGNSCCVAGRLGRIGYGERWEEGGRIHFVGVEHGRFIGCATFFVQRTEARWTGSYGRIVSEKRRRRWRSCADGVRRGLCLLLLLLLDSWSLNADNGADNVSRCHLFAVDVWRRTAQRT